MRALFILCFLVLSGCVTTSLVRKNFTPRRGGVAKYLNEGAGFVIDGRKKSAGQDMRKFCGGDIKIISEDNNPEHQGYTTVPNQTGVYAMSSSYIYVTFECVNQTAAASGY